MKTTILFFICECFVSVLGYPEGNISPACNTMLPQHNRYVPQTNPPPYTITVSKTTFSAGDSISVTIQASSGNVFKGFILEAWTLGGNAITGTFSITNSNTQGLSCSGTNSAVSHTSPADKLSIATAWVAPADVGPVKFRATVLKDFATFWSGVESDILMPVQMSNVTCGTQKFCFSNQANCNPNSNNCFFMSAVPYNDGFVIEMSGSPPNPGYVAIGFSDDQIMGSDDIYICTTSSTGVMVQRALSMGHLPPQSRNLSTTGSVITSYQNGVLKCTFITLSSISTQARANTTSYYIFLANGPSLANGQIQKHSQTPSISASKIDLSRFVGSVNAQGDGTRNLVLGHGALMLIAWMTTGTIGMLIARYMKLSANQVIHGKGLWFLIHVFFMILTVILTIIAFIMIFAKVSGWSDDAGAHPVLGCIVMILSFLQPFGALLRPEPNHKRRFIFNWVHGLNALVIKVLAVATIFLGLKLVDSSTIQWLPKVMGGFYAWEVLFYIILEINKHVKSKGNYEVPDKMDHNETTILGIFICGNIAFLISLLVGIGSS
ncbi:hypothetical protein GDO86_007727 [Hymenochirus boettgeri]|uniref:Ferric-chelate reductase 1 n=1 Tax=Hymenochirus boettgeri TaxID=247094 RepID=A0A8T2IZ27_9PIPI|nr:hypothetical protein GDO86_007727 [Hymenochirus boettgeri]KAG8436748.1 hypothetical protein GDO86_007727 [Hymenochirus boettgeri]